MWRHPHETEASAGGVEAAPHAGVTHGLSRASGEDHQRVHRRYDLPVKVAGDLQEQTARKGDVKRPGLLGGS